MSLGYGLQSSAKIGEYRIQLTHNAADSCLTCVNQPPTALWSAPVIPKCPTVQIINGNPMVCQELYQKAYILTV